MFETFHCKETVTEFLLDMSCDCVIN